MKIGGGAVPREVSRAQLKRYHAVISMWVAKFDTAEIAAMQQLPEWMVTLWIANYRDLMFDLVA